MLTVVGGRIVYGDDDYATLAPSLPPAMPDWSPARRKDSGYYKSTKSGPAHAAVLTAAHALAQASCGCASSCNVHGHAHGKALNEAVSDDGQTSFWGALGCSCWAF